MSRTVAALLALGACVVSSAWAFQGTSGSHAWENPSEAVARVDGVEITKGQVVQSLWDWGAQVTMEELIDTQIILNAAQAKGVSATPEEVDARLAKVAGDLPAGQTIEDLLRMSNMTLARLKARLKAQILMEKILADEVVVTDSDLDQVHAKHILIRLAPASSAEEAQTRDNEAKQAAEAARARLIGGESFDSVAREVSQDPLSKDAGGDLGFIPRGRMPDAFDKVAFSLKVGEISDLVRTQLGYHIVTIVERKPGSELTPEEKEAVKAQVMERLVAPKMQPWFEEHKSAAKIERLLKFD
jgi:parvulin-like peptidyl-prolyl isomerase